MEDHAHVVGPQGGKERPAAAFAEMLTAAGGGESRDNPDRRTEDDVARKMASFFDAGDTDQGRDNVRWYADFFTVVVCRHARPGEGARGMAGRKGVGVFAVGSGAADGGLDSLGQNVVENPRLSQAEGECPIPLVVGERGREDQHTGSRAYNRGAANDISDIAEAARASLNTLSKSPGRSYMSKDSAWCTLSSLHGALPDRICGSRPCPSRGSPNTLGSKVPTCRPCG